MLSIFYFEYSQAISNRDFRKRKAYMLMTYIGKSRKRSLITQLIGGMLIFFVVFIRYTCFGLYDGDEKYGRWPYYLNAIFNGFAHYLFIIGYVLVLIPIFIGKLSIIRDIYAASFFKPLSRICYTTALL